MNMVTHSDAGINILLVDDEPKNLTVLETILDDRGYRLVRAESADQALLALVAEEFALIVLDIQMPGMNGFELATMIKQRKKTATVPIIFLTAYYSQDQHVIEGYETGAVDFLHKPVNPTVLRSKVAVFADLYRKNQEIAAANRALVAEIEERKSAQAQITQLNEGLESRVHDRTAELLRAYRSLAETQEMLNLAQQSGQVGMWDWDLSTGQWNGTKSAWEILNPAAHGGSATYAELLSCVHPDDRERVASAMERIGASGDRYRDEFRVLGGDEVKWVEAVGLLERDGETPIRIRGSLRDITERKVHELELKAADRRKDEFLAMLGHEIRNPLAPIRNAVFILRQITQDNSPDLLWCTDVLDRQSQHLTHLVDDLLDVSRISRGKVHLHREVFDLATAIERAVETCRPLINARRHALSIAMPPEAIYINGDATRLAQVVANLLNNAAKYSDEAGAISINVGMRTGATPQAIIRVRDNGRGLDLDSLDNLFELFFQGRRSLDRADGGLGIGLALARILVEMHDGTIEAQSDGPGKGSEFCVRIPCTTGPSTPSNTTLLDELPGEITEFTVLVAEDNLDVAATMAKTLSLLGCEVHLVHDGLRAVEVAQELRPQAILMDIGLPGLNGYDACELLRRQGLDQTMIVAITGYGQDHDRQRSREAGFDEHLVKPVDIAQLRRLFTAHQKVSAHQKADHERVRGASE